MIKPFGDASPGVKESICGWQFVYAHLNDRIPDNIEIKRDGATYKFSTGNDKVANEAIKIITK